MTTTLLIDVLLVVLLLITIGYCVVVHRKLSILRGAQNDMQAHIATFDQAASRAEANLNALKETAADVETSLGQKLEEGRVLVSDLDMLIHRAGKLTDQVEAGTRQRRSARKPSAKPKDSAAAATPTAPRVGTGRSRSEKELIAALGKGD